MLSKCGFGDGLCEFGELTNASVLEQIAPLCTLVAKQKL